jgi:hypothetical protein
MTCGCAIVATALYVSLGAKPAHRTGVTKSGIADDVLRRGAVVVSERT